MRQERVRDLNDQAAKRPKNTNAIEPVHPGNMKVPIVTGMFHSTLHKLAKAERMIRIVVSTRGVLLVIVPGYVLITFMG